MAKKGSLSITSENIFPVIKKWLYSDHDIFYRELISNGCDAITKLKKLELMGEYEKPEEVEYKIQVSVNPTDKTITIEDNGLGMTEEEIDKYINQIAFSGVQDFMEKYKDKANEDQIIGHFGLGFYSAFMVADKVEINSLSYQKDAKPVHWESEGGINFEMTEGDKAEVGTSIKLYLNEESTEFANEYRAREVIEKYCAFMPVEIYFEDAEEEAKTKEAPAEEAEGGDTKTAEPAPINDTHPLWQKAPSECTEQEYKDFYHKVFHDYRDPLFYIHLSADYPLNFKGILYFPKLNHEYESLEGQVKLYYNQVFVADNIKEVIPEFLLMLRGVLDCPELPLNVSRSYLQSNGYVAKISAHIVKKVADKLCGMFANDRAGYEALWQDLSAFVEYGSLREKKFFDRVKGAVLLRTTASEGERRYVTLDEYLEAAKKTNENTVYYTTDPTPQAQDRSGLKFVRIDADVASALCQDGDAAENEAVTELFRKVSGNEKLKVEYRRLKDESVPALLNVAEESRRFADMMRMYQPGGASLPQEESLVVNAASPLIEKLSAEPQGEKAEQLARQIYALAQLSQRRLSAEELAAFLKNSYALLLEM